jgi:Flp pilus assembly protein TadD
VPPLGAASSAAPKAGPVAEAPGPTAAKPSTAKPSATKSPKPSETKSEVTAATKRAAHPPPSAASAKTRKPRAPAVDEAVVEQQVSAGTAALLANHPEEAAAQFRSAIARDGNNAHAWRGLGLALERKHDTVSALGAYQRYLSLSSPGPQQDAVRKRMRALEP